MTISRSVPSPTRLLTTVAVLLALLAGACGDSDTSVDDALAGGDSGGAGSGGSESSTSEFIFSADFETVCRGVGLEGASPYVPGDGRPMVLAFSGASPDFTQFSGLPDEWEPGYDDLSVTELVACLDRTSEVSDQICDGYEDEGTTWSVEVFSAVYDVTLRDAQTAEILGETTIDAPSDGCPMFSFFSEGDPSPKPDYPSPTDALEAFLAPFINA